jgi:hypothetical protein
MEQIQPFDFDTWCNTNHVPAGAATTLENAGYNLYDSLATLTSNSDVWITDLSAVLPGHQAIIKKAIENLASQFANTVDNMTAFPDLFGAASPDLDILTSGSSQSSSSSTSSTKHTIKRELHAIRTIEQIHRAGHNPGNQGNQTRVTHVPHHIKQAQGKTPADLISRLKAIISAKAGNDDDFKIFYPIIGGT